MATESVNKRKKKGIDYPNLILYKVGANLKHEAALNYLHYFWWVFEPLLNMLVYYVVFGLVLNRGAENFVPFLLIGTVHFLWFSRSVSNSMSSLLGAAGLMQQVNIRKFFFPLVVTLQDIVKQVFVTVILLVLLWLWGFPPRIEWFALLPLYFCQYVLTLGCAFFAAGAVPFVKDLRQIIPIALQLLLFGSGVFYSIEDFVLPEHRFYLYLNPIAGLLQAYRDVLMGGTWPNWPYVGAVFAASIAIAAAGYVFLNAFDRTYPKIVT